MKASLIHNISMMGCAAICMFALGCSNSTEPEQVTNADPAEVKAPVPIINTTPGEAVAIFLNAIREGNKNTAEQVLTTKARQQTEAVGMFIDPEADNSATFKVGEVQIENGEAQVFATWLVKGVNGEDDIEEKMVWLLKKENTSWQIFGLATESSGDVLDFENPNAVCEPDPTPTPIPVNDRRQGAPTPAIALPPPGDTTTQ